MNKTPKCPSISIKKSNKNKKKTQDGKEPLNSSLINRLYVILKKKNT